MADEHQCHPRGALARPHALRILSTHGKGSRAPWASTTDLIRVGQLSKVVLVAKGHIDDAHMGQGGHGGDGSALLSASRRSRRHKETSILAVEATRCPLFTASIPECLPLCREVAISRGDAEEEGIVRGEDVGGDGRDLSVLGGCVHLSRYQAWVPSLCSLMFLPWSGPLAGESRPPYGQLGQ